MTLAHARALLGGGPVDVRRHDVADDQRALVALGRWAMRFTPSVGLDPEPQTHGLLLDITGCERLFKGFHRMLSLIGESLHRLGFSARLAAAPTLGAAWAVARFCPHCRPATIVHPQRLTQRLAPLPVRGLRLEPQVIEALEEVGLLTIGDLLHLPANELPSRFGDRLNLRLRQALGEVEESFELLRPRMPLWIEHAFPAPMPHLEAVSHVTRHLLDELALELSRRSAGVRELWLVLLRGKDGAVTARLVLTEPTCDSDHLWALLWPRLERLDLGRGVEIIRLHAAVMQRFEHQQLEYNDWRGSGTVDATVRRKQAELIDLLSARLGPGRVRCIEPVATHIPERSFRTRAALEPPSPSPAPAPSRGGESPPAAMHPAAVDARAIKPADRPSTLLARPEPITVLSLQSGGAPARLTWRGRTLSVLASEGPERIAAVWWRQDPLAGPYARDYFKVQDETGRWLWIYRQRSEDDRHVDAAPWFVHGQWA